CCGAAIQKLTSIRSLVGICSALWKKRRDRTSPLRHKDTKKIFLKSLCLSVFVVDILNEQTTEKEAKNWLPCSNQAWFASVTDHRQRNWLRDGSNLLAQSPRVDGQTVDSGIYQALQESQKANQTFSGSDSRKLSD